MRGQRQRITKSVVNNLRPGDTLADDAIIGFQAKCLPSGAVTYAYRYKIGETRKTVTIGTRIAPDQARAKAGELEEIIQNGGDPLGDEAKAKRTVNWLLDEYLAQRQGLRSLPAIKGAFNRHVRPAIGGINIYDLKKSTIADTLDRVAKTGPVMADRVLAYVRKAFNWQSARDDDFTPPIAKGMARTRPIDSRRDRILDDEEIREVITAVDELVAARQAPSCYARFLRALLLTGLRRSEVANGRHDEISRDRWVIPAARMKGKVAHLVPVTATLKPLLGVAGYLFSNDGGRTAFSGFEKPKVALDRKIAAARKCEGRKPLDHWTLHDLRRTARSILSRYTTHDIAERVLAHAIGGVRAHYDLYEYENEKRAALEALARHIDGVLHPRPDKLLRLPQKDQLAARRQGHAA